MHLQSEVIRTGWGVTDLPVKVNGIVCQYGIIQTDTTLQGGLPCPGLWNSIRAHTNLDSIGEQMLLLTTQSTYRIALNSNPHVEEPGFGQGKVQTIHNLHTEQPLSSRA